MSTTIPLPHGIYFGSFVSAAEKPILLAALQSLTNDTLATIAVTIRGKPVDLVTVTPAAAGSKPCGTQLIRDLTNKRSDCSVNLDPVERHPMVEIRVDPGVWVGNTSKDSGTSDPVTKAVSVLQLQSASFPSARNPGGHYIFDPNALSPVPGAWVATVLLQKGDGSATTNSAGDRTKLDNDPQDTTVTLTPDAALSKAAWASPEGFEIVTALGHELVHAWRQSYVSSSAAFGGSVVRVNDSTATSPTPFQDASSLEETMTVGLTDPSPGLYLNTRVPNDPRIPTENRIRAEQGKKLRVAYGLVKQCPIATKAYVKLSILEVTFSQVLDPTADWTLELFASGISSTATQTVPLSTVTPGSAISLSTSTPIEVILSGSLDSLGYSVRAAYKVPSTWLSSEVKGSLPDAPRTATAAVTSSTRSYRKGESVTATDGKSTYTATVSVFIRQLEDMWGNTWKI